MVAPNDFHRDRILNRASEVKTLINLGDRVHVLSRAAGYRKTAKDVAILNSSSDYEIELPSSSKKQTAPRFSSGSKTKKRGGL